MKKVIGFACVLLGCTALGAAPACAEAPWSGFYVGGNLGWTGDVSDLSFDDHSGAQNLTFSSGDGGGGVFAGLHTGYGGLTGGNMYIGIEGDIDWAENVDYIASIRGRLGWVSNRWLIYGTLGFGFATSSESFNAISAVYGPFSFDRSHSGSGWVGGVGAEYVLSPSLTLGAEALWYAMGSDKNTLVTAFGEEFSVEHKSEFGVIRARLTWYVNG